MNHTVAAELHAQGALDLSRGGSEIILVRISLILLVLIRALLEQLKSGQSVAVEAVALVLLAGFGGAGPCVLQISLISLLMDWPAPGSVSGWVQAIPPLPCPSGTCQAWDALQTSPLPPSLPLSLSPVSCRFQPMPEGSNTKRSVSQREVHSSQLGYPA